MSAREHSNRDIFVMIANMSAREHSNGAQHMSTRLSIRTCTYTSMHMSAAGHLPENFRACAQQRENRSSVSVSMAVPWWASRRVLYCLYNDGALPRHRTMRRSRHTPMAQQGGPAQPRQVQPPSDILVHGAAGWLAELARRMRSPTVDRHSLTYWHPAEILVVGILWPFQIATQQVAGQLAWRVCAPADDRAAECTAEDRGTGSAHQAAGVIYRRTMCRDTISRGTVFRGIAYTGML